MRFIKSLLLHLSVAAVLTAPAREVRHEIAANPDKAGGVYCVYPEAPAEGTPAPEGYAPFYISHYGRHGSRWLLHDREYAELLDMFDRAAAADALSPRGREVHQRVRLVHDDGIDRAGDLTPKGAAQHRGIAERMFRNYPGIFGDSAVIYARSTYVVRCVLSMAAFCERLKEENPSLQITRVAGNRTTRYLNFFHKLPGSPVCREYLDFIEKGDWREPFDRYARTHLPCERLMGELFSDAEYARKVDGWKLMQGLFAFARGMQNVEPDVSFYDLFTPDELYWLSVCDNYEYYVTRGPSPLNRRFPQYYAKVLVKEILDRADRAVAGEGPAADLRFGHDGNVMALVPLLRFEGYDGRYEDPQQIAEQWPVFRLSPMAANIQFVFYRHEKSGEVLVKMLHNERETRIPIPSVSGPYYSWPEVRAFYSRLLDELPDPAGTPRELAIRSAGPEHTAR